MKKFWGSVSVTSFLLLSVTGCGAFGGGDKAKLVASCIAGGDTKSHCECAANLAAEKLDTKLMSIMVKASDKDEKVRAEVTNLLTNLQPEQMQQFMDYSLSLPGKCGVDG